MRQRQIEERLDQIGERLDELAKRLDALVAGQRRADELRHQLRATVVRGEPPLRLVERD